MIRCLTSHLGISHLSYSTAQKHRNGSASRKRSLSMSAPISRWRDLTELPLGKISISHIGTEELGVVGELQLRIGSDILRYWRRCL